MTKWRGVVASIAPAGVFVAFLPMQALAGGCSETVLGSGNYTCSGATEQATDTQNVISGLAGQDISVITTAGFGSDSTVNSPNGGGLNVRSTGGDISIVDANASPIIADREGITVGSRDGDITVDWSGDISTNIRDGMNVNAREESGTVITNMTVSSSGDIDAARWGILARNAGRGTQDINILGDVTSNGFNLLARNDGGDQSIYVGPDATISGGATGLLVYHGVEGVAPRPDITSASGDTSVIVEGDILNTGWFEAAIAVWGGSTTDEMLVSTSGLVEGRRSGIQVDARGSGATVVTTTNAVSGATLRGIDVTHGGTDLNIAAAGAVTGGTDGVQATNNGTGDTTITSEGPVEGANGAGIVASNGATAGNLTVVANSDVTGGVDAIRVENQGAGQTAVSVAGITTGGTGAAINSVSLADQSVVIDVASTATLEAASGDAIIDTAGDANVSVADGAAVNGAVRLGDGSDSLNFAGDLAGITILDGGDDASSADGMVDTLVLMGVSQDLTGANLNNWEVINLDDGSYSFADNALIAGDGSQGTGLLLTNSTLNGGQSFALTGNMETDATSTFTAMGAGSGGYAVSGSLTNRGTVNMQDGATGDTVTVGQDYAGDGVIAADADFTSNTADQLVVAGDVTAGVTTLDISDVSTGFATGTDIRIVDVGGTSIANAFALSGGDIVAGAFTYGLEQVGSDWYLASSFLTQVPTYEAYPRALLSLSDLDTLQQRTGNRNYLMTGETGSQDSGFWFRYFGERADVTSSASTTNLSYDSRLWGIQAGVELPVYEGTSGTLTGGLNLSFGNVALDVASADGNGHISGDSRSVAATLTWQGDGGFYADAQVQYGKFDTTVHGVENDGSGRSASIELGQKFALSNDWSITPQAQLVWSSVSFDRFTGPDDEQVSLADGDTTRLRLGVSAERSWTDTSGNRNSVYGIFNLHKQLDGDTSVRVSGIDLENDQSEWVGEIGVGGTYSWNEGATSIYGELSVSHDLNGSGGFRAGSVSAGVRWQF